MKDKLPQKTEKPWGFELLFAHTSKYAGKVIFVRKGHRLSDVNPPKELYLNN